MVQWLRHGTIRGSGSIPGWGTKISHAMQPKRKKERKQTKIYHSEANTKDLQASVL